MRLKLIDALKEIKNNSNKVAKKQYSTSGYRYNDDKCKLYDTKNQRYLPLSQTIIFYEEDLFTEGWEVVSVMNPIFKIGDKFVLEDVHGSVINFDHVLIKTIYNAIATITNIKFDGNYIYTLTAKNLADNGTTIHKEVREDILCGYSKLLS